MLLVNSTLPLTKVSTTTWHQWSCTNPIRPFCCFHSKRFEITSTRNSEAAPKAPIGVRTGQPVTVLIELCYSGVNPLNNLCYYHGLFHSVSSLLCLLSFLVTAEEYKKNDFSREQTHSSRKLLSSLFSRKVLNSSRKVFFESAKFN